MEPEASVPEKPESSDVIPGPGFRVRVNIDRPDPGLTKKFWNYALPDISDHLNRLYALASEIRCLTSDHHKVVGPACTVKVFPGDNLMVHKVLDIAKPGDVVVVDASASRMNAVLGGLISTKALHRGIAAFVVDGYVRDLPEIKELGLPVFARGTTPIGPLHRGPGEINYPVSCGGVVVNPGDIVVADSFGIVVVPKASAEGVLGRLWAHKQRNAEYLAGVRKGVFSNRWVDDLLGAGGCTLEDE